MVGYKDPPVEHRFQTGKSGNPGGRKTGSRGLKTDLTAELNKKETIKIGGKLVTDTRQRLAIRTLAIRAANGDLKATQQLLPLILQVLGIEDHNTVKAELSASDQALLDSILNGDDGGIDLADLDTTRVIEIAAENGDELCEIDDAEDE